VFQVIAGAFFALIIGVAGLALLASGRMDHRGED